MHGFIWDGEDFTSNTTEHQFTIPLSLATDSMKNFQAGGSVDEICLNGQHVHLIQYHAIPSYGVI